MHRLLIVLIVLYVGSCVAQAECCHAGHCSPHFFGGVKSSFGFQGFRSRIVQGLDGLGFYSRHLHESEQSIHVPYDSWNIYYYDRSYQFRHHEMNLLANQNMLNDSLSASYDEIQQRNEPRVGNVDSLEFAVLPE